MKNTSLLTLALVFVPLTIEGMVKEKKTTAAAIQAVSHEMAALQALGKCDVEKLEKCLQMSGFNIHAVFTGQQLFDATGWCEYTKDICETTYTLLEVAITMPLVDKREAALARYVRCLQLILRYPGIDVNALADGKYAPLHLAMISSVLPLRTMLSMKEELKLDLNIKSYLGETPLYTAITGPDTKWKNVYLLLNEPGVDPRITNDEGTPLIHELISDTCHATKVLALYSLSVKCDVGVVQALFALAERGANVNSVHKNKTALEIIEQQVRNFRDAFRHYSKHALQTTILGLIALGAHVSLYEVVGVSKTASQDEIKAAYQRLARKYHADRNAEEKFKEVSAAYEVLSDSEKRKQYDQFGHQGPMGGCGGKDMKTELDRVVANSYLKSVISCAVSGTPLPQEEITPWMRKYPNYREELGMTMIMWAAARGNIALAQQLLDLRPDLLSTDYFGNTALHHAVRNGHIEMVKLLKDRAPQAYLAKNCFNRTPVDVAISSKKSREMLLALAE